MNLNNLSNDEIVRTFVPETEREKQLLEVIDRIYCELNEKKSDADLEIKNLSEEIDEMKYKIDLIISDLQDLV